jgi:hypothetical protein
MKTQPFFIDLTQRPPRSFRIRLGNYVVLARRAGRLSPGRMANINTIPQPTRRTATPKPLRSLPNTWAGFPKPGKTSKPGSNSANSMTMSALKEKRKFHIY